MAMSETTIRKYYAAFNARDWDAMCALLTDDVAHDVCQGKRQTGRAAFRTFLDHMDRCYRERTRDLETSLVPIGQRAGRVGRVAGNAHIGEQLHRTLADRLFLVAFESGVNPLEKPPHAAHGAHRDQFDAIVEAVEVDVVAAAAGADDRIRNFAHSVGTPAMTPYRSIDFTTSIARPEPATAAE
jgi:hypothetical protein